MHSCQEKWHAIAGVYSTHCRAGCDLDHTRSLPALQVQESDARLFRRQGTRVIAPKNAVAIAGQHPICPVPNWPRNEFEEKTGEPPGCESGRAKPGSRCELFQDENDSIRPRHQSFGRKLVIDHHIHSIEVPRIRPVPPQNAPSQRTLQRGKSKHASRIAPQNELHQPVAQPADAVIQEDRMGGVGCARW